MMAAPALKETMGRRYLAFEDEHEIDEEQLTSRWPPERSVS